MPLHMGSPALAAGATRASVLPGLLLAVAGSVAFSGKAIIVKLKRYMLSGDTRPIHGEIIQADELWACTTCMASVQECPAHIDIVDTIIDLRRYLTLSEGTREGTPYGFYDLFRLENGKIAEHWDSRRVVPNSTASGLGIF